MSAPEKLVVGLGNPGERYAGTRHNVGWMIVGTYAEEHGADLIQEPTDRKPSRLRRSGTTLFAEPTTYMNRSGTEVGRLMGYYKLEPADLLVVSDDLDLPFGELRLRDTGGSGGHKGLEDIAEQLGTGDFSRLRVGIGRPQNGMDASDFVLQRFSKAEAERLPEIGKAAAQRITEWLDV
ncbi:MAG: aminoacyl-tRNA hydrolase [bacterium]|nr:aminoacyl-tRNA hydrolase [bacterium]